MNHKSGGNIVDWVGAEVGKQSKRILELGDSDPVLEIC